MAKITFDTNEFAEALRDYTIDSVESAIDDTLKLQVSSAFERYCEPYVPFLHGPLSQTTEVEPDYVEYKMPYAHYQYVGEHFNHTLTYHPLATAYWDKVMLQDKGEEFRKQVKDLIVHRISQVGRKKSFFRRFWERIFH